MGRARSPTPPPARHAGCRCTRRIRQCGGLCADVEGAADGRWAPRIGDIWYRIGRKALPLSRDLSVPRLGTAGTTPQKQSFQAATICDKQWPWRGGGALDGVYSSPSRRQSGTLRRGRRGSRGERPSTVGHQRWVDSGQGERAVWRCRRAPPRVPNWQGRFQTGWVDRGCTEGGEPRLVPASGKSEKMATRGRVASPRGRLRRAQKRRPRISLCRSRLTMTGIASGQMGRDTRPSEKVVVQVIKPEVHFQPRQDPGNYG